MWPFFCCYICTCICCLKLHQADYQVGEVFFLPQFWWGALSSNVFTSCAVFWSLGRRGYFGVWNIVLVCIIAYYCSLLNDGSVLNFHNLFIIFILNNSLGNFIWMVQILSMSNIITFVLKCIYIFIGLRDLHRNHYDYLFRRWMNSSVYSAAYMHQWIGSTLFQIMACCLFGAKPLSKPMQGHCQLDP